MARRPGQRHPGLERQSRVRRGKPSADQPPIRVGKVHGTASEFMVPGEKLEKKGLVMFLCCHQLHLARVTGRKSAQKEWKGVGVSQRFRRERGGDTRGPPDS